MSDLELILAVFIATALIVIVLSACVSKECVQDRYIFYTLPKYVVKILMNNNGILYFDKNKESAYLEMVGAETYKGSKISSTKRCNIRLIVEGEIVYNNDVYASKTYVGGLEQKLEDKIEFYGPWRREVKKALRKEYRRIETEEKQERKRFKKRFKETVKN